MGTYTSSRNLSHSTYNFTQILNGSQFWNCYFHLKIKKESTINEAGIEQAYCLSHIKDKHKIKGYWMFKITNKTSSFDLKCYFVGLIIIYILNISNLFNWSEVRKAIIYGRYKGLDTANKKLRLNFNTTGQFKKSRSIFLLKK